MKEKIEIVKQVYIKPTLIEMGKMQIVTKDNAGSKVSDSSTASHMCKNC